MHILIQHYDDNPPQYDQALTDNHIRFDLDPFLKVTEVKLEVKLSQFQQNIPYVIKYAHL